MKRRLGLTCVLVVFINVKLWFLKPIKFAVVDALNESTVLSTPKPIEIGSNVSLDLNKQLTAHFKLKEFACGCGGKLPGCKLAIPDQAKILADKLEIVRSHFYPRGLRIVSGYRCPKYNESPAVGGVGDSQHLYGKAADIPPVVPHSSIIVLKMFTGIGWNKSDGKVTHVDIRHGNPASPATWTYPIHG